MTQFHETNYKAEGIFLHYIGNTFIKCWDFLRIWMDVKSTVGSLTISILHLTLLWGLIMKNNMNHTEQNLFTFHKSFIGLSKGCRTCHTCSLHGGNKKHNKTLVGKSQKNRPFIQTLCSLVDHHLHFQNSIASQHRPQSKHSLPWKPENQYKRIFGKSWNSS